MRAMCLSPSPNDPVNVTAAIKHCFQIQRDPPLTFNRLFAA
jgi:hypothetical protein